MAKLKVVLNRAGVRELMQSPEMQAILKEHADATAAALGEGYEVTTRVGKNRANAEVAAVTYQTRKDQLENNTILKALR